VLDRVERLLDADARSSVNGLSVLTNDWTTCCPVSVLPFRATGVHAIG